MESEIIIKDQEKLKRLLDLDYPLLKEFRAAAPGSFKHCQNVMNFCEPIASELGLDVGFIKVCALYHDVGKMFNPKYFSENQNGDNPIDLLDPLHAYQILTRHVSDGAMILLNEEDFPVEAIKVISKHHGDTILKSIFIKTKGMDEDVFRYRGQKPHDTYSSILMIVDSIEATARSLYNSEKMKDEKDRVNVIRTTIKKLKEDKQLDEMKVGTLRLVEEKLFRELNSVYHNRVPYDTPVDEKKVLEIEGDETVIEESLTT